MSSSRHHYSSRDHHYSRRRSLSPSRDNGSRDYDQQKRYGRRDDYNREYRRPYQEEHKSEQNEPNINVVLRNLPDNAREVDIQNRLIELHASIDHVSLVKDRDTGESRKFAFIRFTSVGHAIQFVDKYPNFDMNSYRVRVDYCKKTKQEDDLEEWRCKKCGKYNVITRRTCIECKQSYISYANEIRTNESETIEINDGMKDISTTPSNMLLLRQLDHLSTEESIFQSLHSNVQGVYRSLLIRDKMTKMSCEYAFVEFTDLQYAKLGLDYARQLLEIDGRRVSVSYANAESFIPVYGQSEYSIQVYDGLAAYWDKSSYASEYSLEIEQEKKRKQVEEEEAKRLKEEESKKLKEEAKKPAVEKTLDDDLDAFYAEMGDFGADTDDIFSVPKVQ